MGSSNLATPASPTFSIAANAPPRLSFNSLLLFAIGLSLAASGFRALRVDIGGLMVHPYLFVVGAIFPILILTRLLYLPRQIVLSLLVFAGLYFASTFSGGVWIGEGLKIAAAVVTIVAAALLVRSRTDFVAGVLGLSIAIAFLAVNGLESDRNPAMGVKAMDIANRNAYSLYALPAILLGGYMLMQKRKYPLILNLVTTACVFLSVLVVFLSLNRSGWIGVLVIGLMLFRDRRIRGLFLAATIALGVYFLVSKYYGTEHIEARISKTWESLGTDHIRVQLIIQSVEIGMENPLFGVSPQELSSKLGRRLGYSTALVDSHNVFAHVMAGSGLVCLAALFYIGWILWRWKLTPRPPPEINASFSEAHKLLRMMVVLWVVRGMFTHEILYSPGFCVGLGLCIGLCVISAPTFRHTRHRSYRRASVA